VLVRGARPNSSFNPNLLRSTNNMAGRACHVVGSTTQVGLTQGVRPHQNKIQRWGLCFGKFAAGDVA